MLAAFIQRCTVKMAQHIEPVRTPCLPATTSAAAALILEAVGAVDRLIATRHERHKRLTTTRRAGCAVHLALAAVTAATRAITIVPSIPVAVAVAAPASRRLPLLSTRRAARRLVGEPFLGVKLLFA